MSLKKTAEIQELVQQAVVALLQKKPDDPIPHIIQFLQDKKGEGQPPLTLEERLELDSLKNEYEKLKEKRTIAKKTMKAKSVHMNLALSSDSEDSIVDKASSSSDSSYLDEENDDFSPDAQRAKVLAAQRARQSVSAEVFGKYHIQAKFEPKTI